MYIYLRILGYTATIVMHVTNMVAMATHLDSKDSAEMIKDPVVKAFASMQARYFTCWTFFLQIVYAVIGLSCDVLTLKNSSQKAYRLPKHLRGCRDTLFAAIIWPSTLLVASLFWSLFHIDRNLILPAVLDKVLSRTSNHVIHTAIIPVVLWEVMFRPRQEPRSHWRNIVYILFSYVLYFSVLFYTYYAEGKWIYPIFGKAYGTIYFPLFMLAIFVILFIYYFIQWRLTRLFHGDLIDKSKIL